MPRKMIKRRRNEHALPVWTDLTMLFMVEITFVFVYPFCFCIQDTVFSFFWKRRNLIFYLELKTEWDIFWFGGESFQNTMKTELDFYINTQQSPKNISVEHFANGQYMFKHQFILYMHTYILINVLSMLRVYRDIVQSSLLMAEAVVYFSPRFFWPCLHLIPNKPQSFISIRSTISSSSEGWGTHKTTLKTIHFLRCDTVN